MSESDEDISQNENKAVPSTSTGRGKVTLRSAVMLECVVRFKKAINSGTKFLLSFVNSNKFIDEKMFINVQF